MAAAPGAMDVLPPLGHRDRGSPLCQSSVDSWLSGGL